MTKPLYLISVLALSLLVSACSPGFEPDTDNQTDRNKDRNEFRKNDDDKAKRIEPVSDDKLWKVANDLRPKLADFDQNKAEIAATFNSLGDTQVGLVLNDFTYSTHKIHCLWGLNDRRVDSALAEFWKTHTLVQSENEKHLLTADFIASHPFHSVTFSGRKDINQKFIEDLSKSTTLRSLDFSGSKLDATALAALSNLQNLEKLNLSRLDGEVTDQTVKNILPLSQLKSLGLAGADITNETLDTLQNFAALANLDLSNTGPSFNKTNQKWHGINIYGLHKLQTLKCLRSLNLTSTIGLHQDVSYRPAQERQLFVTEVLKLNQVTHLTLSYNLLTAEQGKLLAEKGTHLEFLNLSVNSLAENPTFGSLFGMPIETGKKPSDEAIPALVNNQNLKTLILTNNGFSNGQLKAFEANTTLELLEVSGKEIDATTKEALIKRFGEDNVKFAN